MWECMCHTDVAACTNDRYLGLHEKDNCMYERKGCMFFGFVFLGLVAIVVIVILIRID